MAREFRLVTLLAAGICATMCVGRALGADEAAQPTVMHAARVIHCCGGEEDGHSGDAQHCSAVATGVAITPDGRTVAAALDDQCVVIWMPISRGK